MKNASVPKRHGYTFGHRALYALMAVCGLGTGLFGNTAVGGADVNVRAETAAEAASLDVTFPDVTETDWFYPYVTQLFEDGYVVGRETGLYDPQGRLTVAEASTMIVRCLGLEDAAQNRKTSLEDHKRGGSELWYAGYMQLMYEAGLIMPNEYAFNVRDGEIVIGEETRFGNAITREEFARIVNGSFKLDETQIRSNTPLDPGHLGHGFEVEYTYNDTTAAAYADAISDYDTIPENAREAVLRTYMNGIFQGDQEARFNPLSHLTRAEMAKVITVILHKDMRTFAEVSLQTAAQPEEPPQTPDDTLTPAQTPDAPILPPETVPSGEKLTREQIDTVLQTEYEGISTAKNNDGSGRLEFRSQHSVPEGYQLKIYHFVGTGGGLDADMAASVNNDGSNYYSCAFFGGDRIVLALEDAANGETVGILLLQLAPDGTLINQNEQYLP